MNRERLNTAIEQSGLSRDEIRGMSTEDLCRYFCSDNYHHMFGPQALERIGNDGLMEVLEYAIEIRGGLHE
jgi:hypothetical protein